MTTEPSTTGTPAPVPSGALPAAAQVAAAQPALPAGSVREDPWWARMGFQILGDTAAVVRFLAVLLGVLVVVVIAVQLAALVSPDAVRALGPLLENTMLRWIGGTLGGGAVVTVGGRAAWRRWPAHRGAQAPPSGDEGARPGSRAAADGGDGEGCGP